MDLKLDNKRALVTGSSRGIGEAIARALAAEGVAVAIHGREISKVSDVAQQISREVGEAIAVAGNLTTEAGAEKVVEATLDQLGGIDILVNNAGHFEVCSWDEGDADRWASTYNSEVLSMVRLIQRVTPAMREAGWGRIIQVASISASIAPPFFPDYAAAKAAVVNLTVSLMQELAGSGITVNTVSPGPVPTETWQTFALQVGRRLGWENEIAGVKEKLLAGPLANPTGRFGRPQDVADLVAFLASPRASHINGINVPVSGGLSARAC